MATVISSQIKTYQLYRSRLKLRIRSNTKGTLHPKMGKIKDRNAKDLLQVEEIQKRWQEYTEELYNKGLNEPDNHNDVVTHLEPDILKCEVKWALGSITTNKASRGDGISSWAISNPKR